MTPRPTYTPQQQLERAQAALAYSQAHEIDPTGQDVTRTSLLRWNAEQHAAKVAALEEKK